eukprot:UN10974
MQIAHRSAPFDIFFEKHTFLKRTFQLSLQCKTPRAQGLELQSMDLQVSLEQKIRFISLKAKKIALST